jgi:uncharacterized RDD family membrane protein YckC
MEQILDMPVAEKKYLDYAGFGIRFIAALIDGIILQVVQVGLAFVIDGGYAWGNESGTVTLVAALIGLGYHVMMTSSATQATLGKMAVGIKIGDENGGRISPGRAIGRYLSQIISLLILFIGYLMVIWDGKKQSLHDKIAGTYVFKD